MALPAPLGLGGARLGDVLRARASRRSFAGPLDDESLAALLAASCRTLSAEPSAYGFPLEYRPTPSAGALHPVHVLVQQLPGQPWKRYDSLANELVEVLGSEANAQKAREAANELVPCADATIFGFAAEVGRTSVKYVNAESLVWRDAGAVVAYLHLCAEAVGLAFTPLGISGDPFLRALDGEDRLRGVGMALAGLRKA